MAKNGWLAQLPPHLLDSTQAAFPESGQFTIHYSQFIILSCRLFAVNQSKCLSMNNLHAKLSFSGQPQSSRIKPNQVIFIALNRPLPPRKERGDT
jgi:hypothetical protein